MGAVAYADTFGDPGHEPFHRLLRALSTPLITHAYHNADLFPYEHVEVVPLQTGLVDLVAAGVRRIKTRHGYRLPMSVELKLMDRMLERGATTVHAYGGAAGARIAPVARRLECRLVVTVFGSEARAPTPGYRQAMKGLARDAALLIAPNRTVHRHLRDLECPEHKLELLPFGVGLRPMRPRRTTSRETVRALSVGRLRPVNGMAELVEAVALARRMGAPLTLDIVGDGTERAKVLDSIERSGLSGHVRLHGDLVGSEMRKLMDTADFFVLNCGPSEEEELPTAVLEAMVSGLCVVSTDTGSIPELVRDDVTGILLKEHDTSALAGAMVKASKDAGMRVAFGAAGRARAERDYDLALCVERLRELYQ